MKMKLIKLNLPIDFNAIQTGELRYFFKPYVWDDVGYNYIFENQSLKNAQNSSSIQDALVSHLNVNINEIETISTKVKDSINSSLKHTITESTDIQELDQTITPPNNKKNAIQEVIALSNDIDRTSDLINSGKEAIQTIIKDNNTEQTDNSSLNNEHNTAHATHNPEQNSLEKDNIKSEIHENNMMNDILSSYKNITKRYNS